MTLKGSASYFKDSTTQGGGEGEGPDDILSRLPLTKCYFPTVKNASANVLRVLNIFSADALSHYKFQRLQALPCGIFA